MSIRIFNTLTKTIEELVPLHDTKINMFVCGPTVYDFSHLGHAKTYIQFDFVARYLRHKGFTVNYLQNITDVDDKIIARAAREGTTPAKLAEFFEQCFREDMERLHVTSVDEYARAHDFVPQIVNQIKRLVDRGFAYSIDDGYYFDVKKFSRYGELSGRTDVRAGDAISRIDENTQKRNQEDFCLWKAMKPGEPSWQTELGPGRPGWHIEDTAITEARFGAQYDIHGGAVDLIFPHHEAEIAQIEAATGISPMVRHWMHTGFLNIKSQKMSKSAGNFVTIREALKDTDPSTLRYWFLSHHYRTSIDLVAEWRTQAESGLARLNTFIRSIDARFDDVDNEGPVHSVRNDILNHLDDDFNTPAALASLFEFIRNQNKSGRPGTRVISLLEELEGLFDFMDIVQTSVRIDKDVKLRIEERQTLRKQRQFAEADKIRAELEKDGIILEDTPTGVKWYRRPH